MPRFLISTHYTRYDWRLFALNFAALVCVLFPKLPSVSRNYSVAQVSTDDLASSTTLPIVPIGAQHGSSTYTHAFQTCDTSKNQVKVL
jgi:hypothetical protein